MPASLNFKKADRKANATTLAEIKTIVYEDSTGNKYTFGVDNNNVFNTFKYDPNGVDPEVDYSTTATKLMTGGTIATLLGIGTNVDAIKTKTDFIPDTFTADVAAIKDATNAANLGNKVTAIQTKTDFIPDTFTADVAAIKDATNAANLGNKVTAIQTKTDKMPDNLTGELATLAKTAELDPLAKTADVTAIRAKTDKIPADLSTELNKLTTIGSAINGNGKVTEAAKLVLESSFKKAITDAGKEGSDWLENSVKNIVSQPVFEIPTDADAALHWTW